MKIFHTTDPHSKWGHILTTVEAASPNSLIAISGDIHNWEAKATVDELQENVKKLRHLAAKAAKKGCHIAVCSGNHDDWATPYFYINWLVLDEPNLHGDLTNKIIQIGEEEILLTCFPWRDYEEPELLDPTSGAVDGRRWKRDNYTTECILSRLTEGEKLREGRPWVWLHHNPPTFTEISGEGEASRILKYWIGKHKPTAVLCGHVHLAFLENEGGTSGHIGNTILSNPGRNRSQVRYNIIDLTKNNVGTVAIPIPTEPQEKPGLPLSVGGIILQSD